MYFLHICTSSPGFNDPEKEFSLEQVYGEMNPAHLFTFPGLGTNRHARFMLLEEACIASTGFVAATMKTDLAIILSRLPKEDTPEDVAPLHDHCEPDFCLAPPLEHRNVLPLPARSHRRGEEEVQLSGRRGRTVPLHASSLSREAKSSSPVTRHKRVSKRSIPISEGEKSSIHTTRPSKYPKMSSPFSSVTIGTQTDGDPAEVKGEPSLARLHRVSLSLLKDRVLHYSELAYRRHLRHVEEEKRTLLSSHPVEPDHALAAVASLAVDNADQEYESALFKVLFGKPLEYVPTSDLVSALMLPSKDFQHRLFQGRVKEALCVRTSSSPKARVRSSSASVTKRREIARAGWLTVKNVFVHNRESARVPGAAILPSALVQSTSVAPVQATHKFEFGYGVPGSGNAVDSTALSGAPFGGCSN